MDHMTADDLALAYRAADNSSRSRARALAARLSHRIMGSPVLGFVATMALTMGLFIYLFLDESLVVLPILSGASLSGSGVAPEIGASLSFTLLAGAWAGRRGARSFKLFRPNVAAQDLQRAEQVLQQAGTACASLYRLGDKQLMFSESGEAFIMYARQGRSLVALFDPVGTQEEWAGLVRSFVALARAARCRPVFYQVSPRFLPFAIEAGLTPHKLGEQAIVDLPDFDLKGGEWLKLRRSINRAERDGLIFEFLHKEQVPPLLAELRGVSDAWLCAHNAAEKGFSLGTFRDDYVCASSVAIIRMEGRIVAFATIPTAEAERDAFIDLMRHIPGTHRGMMDLLFVRIMERLKADGFKTLNLGMAPLAGLSTHRCAPTWHRVCRFIYETGERFYNFQGVQTFKAKFDPRWQPRYLVVSKRGLPLVSILDVTVLIGGGLKGILRR